MLKKIVISEFMDADAVSQLSKSFQVLYQPDLHEHPASLLDALNEADALIVRNQTVVDETLLSRATRLHAVGRLGVGLENIDIEACHRRNVEVIPATGANAAAVAEYVLCAAMQLLRPAYASTGQVLAGMWPRGPLARGREVRGKIMGIVGLGSVGQVTAALAEAVGMAVIAFDPALEPTDHAWSSVRRRTDLDDVLREAHVVSLHVPLAPATMNLIDARRLALMQRNAVLINVARGGVVDERALVAALRQGKLAGAAIDVPGQEPLPSGSIFVDVPNLLLTPHIAGVTSESNVRVSFLIAERIAECFGTTIKEEA